MWIWLFQNFAFTYNQKSKIEELLSNIKTDNSVSEIDKTNKNYVEFIKQNESILDKMVGEDKATEKG